MSKMNAFNERVLVKVRRGAEATTVMFCDVQDGDQLVDFSNAVVDGDAHPSGDASYEGWLFFDTDGNDYYPEDFAGE